MRSFQFFLCITVVQNVSKTKKSKFKYLFSGGVPVEASDARCTHLVVEDSVTELPNGLLEQSNCQAVKQEVSANITLLSSNNIL